MHWIGLYRNTMERNTKEKIKMNRTMSLFRYHYEIPMESLEFHCAILKQLTQLILK